MNFNGNNDRDRLMARIRELEAKVSSAENTATTAKRSLAQYQNRVLRLEIAADAERQRQQ